MKRFIIVFLLPFLGSQLMSQAPNSATLNDALQMFPEAREQCGLHALQQYKELTDPGYLQRRQEVDAFTKNWIENGKHQKTAAVVTIPVVVHVVYANATQNVSDAQIQSQIDVLNADFRRQNSDTSNTPSDFGMVVADTEIEFCLASTDPAGNATTGITRTQTNVPQIGDAGINYTAQGGKDGWDPNSYLNIWVCEIISNGGILGYATPPGFASTPAEDGAVIDYRYLGTMGTAVPPFNGGRTATHELGHYFNLDHVWGGNGGCNDDDQIGDTPNQTGPNYGCPSHPSSTCNSPDMFMNYMDYVNDDCMNSFTQGQKDFMMAALNGPRSGLLNSGGCSGAVAVDASLEQPIFTAYPNPSTGRVKANVQLTSVQDIELTVYSLLGERLLFQNRSQVSQETFDLNLESFPEGMYLLELKSNDSRLVKRIIKQ